MISIICAFFLSAKGRQAIIDLHIDGIISYLNEEDPKPFKYRDFMIDFPGYAGISFYFITKVRLDNSIKGNLLHTNNKNTTFVLL